MQSFDDNWLVCKFGSRGSQHYTVRYTDEAESKYVVINYSLINI